MASLAENYVISTHGRLKASDLSNNLRSLLIKTKYTINKKP